MEKVTSDTILLKQAREKPPHPRLSPEEYYYSMQGFIVFTEAYHLNRGYCCKSGCLHCPYENKKNNLASL